MKQDDNDFMDLIFVIVLFIILITGSFWAQHKFSNATPYFETDIKE